MPITDDQIVYEWNIRTGQAVTSVAELAKAVRAETRHEKNRTLALEKMGLAQKQAVRSTEKLTAATESLSKRMGESAKGMALSIAKGTILTNVLGVVKDGLKEAAKEAVAYTNAIDNQVGSIDKAQERTKGLVSGLDLLQSRIKLNTLGVRFSDAEYAKLAEGTAKLALLMDRDLKPAFDDITTGLARNSSKILDNLGLVVKAKEANEKYAASIGKTVDQLTDEERAIAFRTDALDQMAKKTADVTLRVNTLSAAYGRATTFLKNWIHQIGRYINVQGGKALHNALNPFRELPTLAGELGKGSHRIEDALFRQQGGGLLAGDETLGRYAEQSAGISGGLTARGGGGGMGGGFGTLEQQAAARARYLKENAEAAKIEERAQARLERQLRRTNRAGVRKRKFGKTELADDKFTDSGKADLPKNLFMGEGMAMDNDVWAEAARGIDNYIDRNRELLSLVEQTARSNKAYQVSVTEVSDYISTTAVSAVAQFTAGLWANYDAVIQGQDTLGMAVSKSLKTIMLAMAAEATVKAVMSLAEFLFTKDPSYLLASGKYLAVAAMAGAGGLAVSSAISAGGGYDSGGSAGASPTASPTHSQSTRSFGKRVENNQPIYLTVLLNDYNSGLSAELAARKLGGAGRAVYTGAAP